MGLQFLNSFRTVKPVGKDYTKPEDIINDPYLSAAQKHIVLQAMLTEAQDEASMTSKSSTRFENEILKAQEGLKGQMD